jgi:hypothetical protein
MKLLMLCTSLLVFTVSNDTVEASKQNDFYYFCTSTGINQLPVDGMQYIFYTEIKQLPADTALVRRMTYAWGKQVKQDCKNSNGCSSDLNMYESKAMAEGYMRKFKERYADEKKYTLIKMSFQ